MKERARELKAEARADRDRAAGESDLLAKIAEMPEPDRTIATRVHAIVTTNAPELQPKTWYGMPAYARDGKILCFLQSAEKFKTRYVTLGFNDGGEARQRRHVADRLCPTGARPRRGEEDRRARQESGALNQSSRPVMGSAK